MYHVLNNNTNVYAYEFTYSSKIMQHAFKYEIPGWYRKSINEFFDFSAVPHGAELGYIFMGGWGSYLDDGLINQTDVDLANFMGESWSNFIKFG